jgi:hypothetical protein
MMANSHPANNVENHFGDKDIYKSKAISEKHNE